MPFYPTANVFQRGDQLLVVSTSYVKGLRMANGWLRLLPVGASDGDLASVVMDALDHSTREEFRNIPKPRSENATLESEHLGFTSETEMLFNTTKVGLTREGDQVFAAPAATVGGQTYRRQRELPPVHRTADLAGLVREALAESARLSAGVIDHEALAAARSEPGEDAEVRALVGRIPTAAGALVTRCDARWAVEAVSTAGHHPRSMPSGWVRVVDDGDDAELAGALVEALTRSGREPAVEAGESPAARALGMADRQELTRPGCARIEVLGPTGGDILMWAQEINVDGWWWTPEHPTTHTVKTADRLPLWGAALREMSQQEHLWQQAD